MFLFGSHCVVVLVAILADVSGLQSVPPSRALEAAALARLEGLDPPSNAQSSSAIDFIGSMPISHAGYIVGVDEAGTGALAGPVVAAAVWLHPSFDQQVEMQRFVAAKEQNEQSESPSSSATLLDTPIPGLRDSKLLKPAERLAWVEALRSSPALAWATAAVPAARADVIGVAAANAEALELAVGRLNKQLQRRVSLETMPGAEPTRTSAFTVDENGSTSKATMDDSKFNDCDESCSKSRSGAAPVVKLWCLVDGDAVPGALQPNVDYSAAKSTTEVAQGSATTTTDPMCICGASAVPGGDRTELVISTASLFAKVCLVLGFKGVYFSL